MHAHVVDIAVINKSGLKFWACCCHPLLSQGLIKWSTCIQETVTSKVPFAFKSINVGGA